MYIHNYIYIYSYIQRGGKETRTHKHTLINIYIYRERDIYF